VDDIRQPARREADSLAPLEMSNLRRRLVWLEAGIQAGEAYRLEANAAEREWHRLAERVRERLSRPVFGGAGRRREPRPIPRPGTGPCSQLPIAAASRPAGPGRSEFRSTCWQGLKTTLSRLIARKLDATPDNPTTKDLASSVGIVHFLRLAHPVAAIDRQFDPQIRLLAAALQLHDSGRCRRGSPRPAIQAWIEGASMPPMACGGARSDAVSPGQVDPGPGESGAIAYRDALAIENAVQTRSFWGDLIASELPDLARWLEDPDATGAFRGDG